MSASLTLSAEPSSTAEPSREELDNVVDDVKNQPDYRHLFGDAIVGFGWVGDKEGIHLVPVEVMSDDVLGPKVKYTLPADFPTVIADDNVNDVTLKLDSSVPFPYLDLNDRLTSRQYELFLCKNFPVYEMLINIDRYRSLYPVKKDLTAALVATMNSFYKKEAAKFLGFIEVRHIGFDENRAPYHAADEKEEEEEEEKKEKVPIIDQINNYIRNYTKYIQMCPKDMSFKPNFFRSGTLLSLATLFPKAFVKSEVFKVVLFTPDALCVIHEFISIVRLPRYNMNIKYTCQHLNHKGESRIRKMVFLDVLRAVEYYFCGAGRNSSRIPITPSSNVIFAANHKTLGVTNASDDFICKFMNTLTCGITGSLDKGLWCVSGSMICGALQYLRFDKRNHRHIPNFTRFFNTLYPSQYTKLVLTYPEDTVVVNERIDNHFHHLLAVFLFGQLEKNLVEFTDAKIVAGSINFTVVHKPAVPVAPVAASSSSSSSSRSKNKKVIARMADQCGLGRIIDNRAKNVLFTDKLLVLITRELVDLYKEHDCDIETSSFYGWYHRIITSEWYQVMADVIDISKPSTVPEFIPFPAVNLSFSIEDGVDIDMPIRAKDDSPELLDNATMIFEKVKAIWANVVMADVTGNGRRSKLYKISSNDPLDYILRGFRDVEVYSTCKHDSDTGFEQLITYHVPMVRGWFDGEKMMAASSCLESINKNVYQEYHYFASTKTTPTDILTKYEQRGFLYMNSYLMKLKAELAKERNAFCNERSSNERHHKVSEDEIRELDPNAILVGKYNILDVFRRHSIPVTIDDVVYTLPSPVHSDILSEVKANHVGLYSYQ